MINNNQGLWAILLSLVLALVLTILPWPESIASFIPNWFLLVFMYWAIATPHRTGMIWAFVWGLVMDSLVGSLLGAHSFVLCCVTFFMQLSHQKLRVQPLWQQAITIVIVSYVYSLLLFWIARISGEASVSWTYWLQPVANGVLWPWVFIVLRDLRRYFKVS